MHIKGFQTPIQSENCHMNFNVTKSVTDSCFILSHLHMKELQTLEGLASEMIPYMVLFILTWSSDSLCHIHSLPCNTAQRSSAWHLYYDLYEWKHDVVYSCMVRWFPYNILYEALSKHIACGFFILGICTGQTYWSAGFMLVDHVEQPWQHGVRSICLDVKGWDDEWEFGKPDKIFGYSHGS